jgi:integrase
VFELAHETGLRRGDLCLVGRQHVIRDKLKGDIIRIVPRKTSDSTGATATAEITDELRAALDLVPRDRLTFIVGADGEQITPNHLGWLFQGWCREAGLPDRCRLHGLRKRLGARLADVDNDTWAIGAVLGDTDPKSIKVYTTGRDTTALARRAFSRLKEPNQNEKVATRAVPIGKRRRK